MAQRRLGVVRGGDAGRVGRRAEPVYTVRTRRDLIAALNNGAYPPPSSTPSDQPKIIYVDGPIDANVDDAGVPLRCVDYERGGYTLQAYLAAYDPAVWSGVPSGPLEQARVASADTQQARIRVRVGSNTTIVGLDRRAVIKGAWFDIRGAGRTNIIIRNLRFEDTYDCFPPWDPTDGSTGNWNSRYDSISIRDGDHVWIDHNEFADVETVDSRLPTYSAACTRCTTASWTSPTRRTTSRCRGTGSGITTRRCSSGRRTRPPATAARSR